MIRAADSSELLARQVTELKERWLEAAGKPRARSAPRRLVEAIPTHPVLTLATAQSITSLSDEACRRALNRLEQSRVLRESTAGKRNRVWDSVRLFDLPHPRRGGRRPLRPPRPAGPRAGGRAARAGGHHLATPATVGRDRLAAETRSALRVSGAARPQRPCVKRPGARSSSSSGSR